MALRTALTSRARFDDAIRPPSEVSSAGQPAVAIPLAITLVGFFLRVLDLGGPSFWWDDSYSTMVASSGLRDIVATLAREDFHPPLHYFLLHYWLRLVGTSEFSVRCLSVIAGTLAIPAAWIAARRLFGSTAAPVAAALFALSPYLWYYSQEARMFALVPVLGTLALYFCARAADRDRAIDWLGYAVVVLLGVYDYYYFAFVPLAGGAWVWLRSRSGARLGWCAATAAVALLYLPWLPILLTRGAVWSGLVPSLGGPAKTVYWSWTALLLGLPSLSLYGQPFPTALLGLGALATLAATFWSFATRSAWRKGNSALAAIAFIIPLAGMAAISAIKPVFHPRYAIPAEAGLLLVLAGFIGYLVRSPGGRRVAGMGIVGLLVVSSAYGLDRLKTDGDFARDDYRTAIGYVRQNEKPGDTIIHNAVPPFWYYYHGPSPSTYFPTGPYTETGVAAELNRVTRGRSRLWYVTQIDTPSDPDGFVDVQLRQHAALLVERRYAALRVQLWQIPGDDAFAGPAFKPVAANLANELAITGYAVGGEPVGGHALDVELRLEARRAPSADDGFWIGLVDSAGREWGRADARPHDASFSPSSSWPAGTTVVVRTDVPVPVGTPPGGYDVVAGAYRLRDLVGLDAIDENGHPIGQRVRLGSVQITRPSDGSADSSLTPLNREILPGLILTGAKVDATSVGPGDHVPVTLLWRSTSALPPLDANVRLRDAAGQTLAADDGPIGGADPTNQWVAGHPVREQRTVAVPATLQGDSVEIELVPAQGPTVSLGTLTVHQVTRVFALPTPAHPLDAFLGEPFALVGYSVSSSQLRPGSQLTLTLDWQALKTTATSYHVFVHLIDANNHIWAQWDGVPRGWSYPTSAWEPGEYVADDYAIKIPPDAPAGPLAIETGLYDATTGQRLPVVTKGTLQNTDRVLVGMVQIVR